MFLFSVVLAGLVAAGSIPRANRRFNDDKNIQCDGKGVSGLLLLDTLISGSPLPTMPLGIVNDTLQGDGNELQQGFFFKNCTSGFMGETSSIQNGSVVAYG
jgi:hypothetical protein